MVQVCSPPSTPETLLVQGSKDKARNVIVKELGIDQKA